MWVCVGVARMIASALVSPALYALKNPSRSEKLGTPHSFAAKAIEGSLSLGSLSVFASAPDEEQDYMSAASSTVLY